MSAERRRRPVPRAAAIATSPPAVGKKRTAEEADRAISELAAAVDQLANPGPGYVEVDLVVGTNRINHGLGRVPLEVRVMPREASGSFGWGYDWTQPGNPVPERQIWLDVVGAPMTARVFIS